MSLIKCQNITLSYEGQTVVSNLSFEVNDGEYICIVGENGSGKSTLIKSILGLKKPSNGQIIFGDGLKQNEIGYIPQKSVIQKDFPASVYEVVISGCVNNMGLKPFYTKKEKAVAMDNINKLGIGEIVKRPYNSLSGGQQQKVLLARALCATKKILLLDEPVTGLDPSSTAEFYKIINEINKSGITIIMVSHDVNNALDRATSILHLDHNDFLFAKKEDYFNSEKSKRFLGER